MRRVPREVCDVPQLIPAASRICLSGCASKATRIGSAPGSGGLIHGYRGRYRDKIRLNPFGIVPAIPTVGVDCNAVSSEQLLLGNAVMIDFGIRL